MRHTMRLGLVLSLAPLLLLFGSAVSAGALCGNWTVDTLPAVFDSQVVLGIAPVSSSDVWIVGNEQPDGLGYTEHWDGAAWSVVPVPSVPGATSSSLSAVAALSSSDVWALGSAGNEVTGFAPMALHWDGSAWALVPMPSPGWSSGLGLSFFSPSDGWAVGQVGQASFIEHWDGTAWSIVPNPASSSGRQSHLLAVTAISADDAWAVGWGCGSIYGCEGRTIFLHWDGTSWIKISGARSHGRQLRGDLSAVTAVNSNDVWAVGTGVSGVGANKSTIPITEHWDGTAWTRVYAAAGGVSPSSFTSVTSTATGDVWAAGAAAGGGSSLVERWDGARWRNVGKAEPSGLRALSSVSESLSGDGLWAAEFGIPGPGSVEHCH